MCPGFFYHHKEDSLFPGLPSPRRRLPVVYQGSPDGLDTNMEVASTEDFYSVVGPLLCVSIWTVSPHTDVQVPFRSFGTAVLSGCSVFMRHLFRGANAAGPPNRPSSISPLPGISHGWLGSDSGGGEGQQRGG